jgi:hypothetical protein
LKKRLDEWTKKNSVSAAIRAFIEIGLAEPASGQGKWRRLKNWTREFGFWKVKLSVKKL